MPFTTGTKAIPSDNGLRTTVRGDLMVRVSFGTTLTYAVVSVTNLATGTQWAWQLESPSANHLFGYISAPDIDPATGLVWLATASSSSTVSQIMFVALDPGTGEAEYYPTSETAEQVFTAGYTAVVGDYVVCVRGTRWVHRHKSTGAITKTPYSASTPSGVTRPHVYDDKIFMRSSNSASSVVATPATNTITNGPSSPIQAQIEASGFLVGAKAYTPATDGRIIVDDRSANTTSVIAVPAGFVGAAIVHGADGKFYSKTATVLGCWDPVALSAASVAVSGSSVYGFVHGDVVHFCVA